MKDVIEMFTDGACQGNPGVGGWGVLMRYRNAEKELFGGEQYSTNNRMELMAAVEGLRALNREACQIVITTDSEYLRRGITEWIHRWQKQGWKTANKHPVKNQDLWQALSVEAQKHQIEWRWIKGHSGHRENDIADKLARQGIISILEKQA